jgi:hypothetical protein
MKWMRYILVYFKFSFTSRGSYFFWGKIPKKQGEKGRITSNRTHRIKNTYKNKLFFSNKPTLKRKQYNFLSIVKFPNLTEKKKKKQQAKTVPSRNNNQLEL